MARESSLWVWLSKARKIFTSEYLHLNRVENSVMAGMPDVEGCLMPGKQFWIELKSSLRPARKETPVRFKVRDREAQVEWLTRRRCMGGRAWLLLQVGEAHKRRLYLVPGEHAAEVYAGLPEYKLQELDVLQEERPTPETVIRVAASNI